MGQAHRTFRPALLLAGALAALLRFWSLGSIPLSLYCDEAFHGYQAWSLATTGRDLRGVPFPFFFDVFGL
ncbi:MAG TPA: hypothetical protein VJV23_15785, partial [Candidatus Polarisedimenticolia bacterium]|nr:hypothetical protein [Candidatus Polarisedimenticolia bacterium]